MKKHEEAEALASILLPLLQAAGFTWVHNRFCWPDGSKLFVGRHLPRLIGELISEDEPAIRWPLYRLYEVHRLMGFAANRGQGNEWWTRRLARRLS